MSLMNMSSNLQKVDNYLNQLSSNLSPSTRRSYIGDIKQFFGVKEPSEITIGMVQGVTVDTVNEYAEHLFNMGMANSTINRKLQALSKFYNLLMRRDIRAVEYNPFDTTEGAHRFKSTEYSKGKELDDEEVIAMVRVANQYTDMSGLRNKIILYLLLTTGMRREEIASLEIGQIAKTQGRHIISFIGKGRKERFVVLSDNIKDMIDEYLELRGLTYKDKDSPLFISHASNADSTKSITPETIYQMVKKLAKEAGIDESISPHDFRHTYTTKSLDMGCALEDVQDRLGHSDIKTTRRYDHTRRILKDNPADSIMELYTI